MRDVGQRDISLDEGKLMVSGGVKPLIERTFALTGSPVAPSSESAYYSVDSLEDVHLVEAAIAEDPSWGKY